MYKFILFLILMMNVNVIHANPEVLILKSSNPDCSLNKHGQWLEKYLNVPKLVVNSKGGLPENLSNKVIFLTALQYDFPVKEIRQSSDSILCAQSMFEATAVPQEWVDKLNRYFDFLTVPDEFLVTAYKQSGVNIPIFMIPSGFFVETWLQLKPLRKSKLPFVFVASGSLHQPRKNHDLLIEAFQKAFGDREDVQLKIQVRGHSNDPFQKKANELIEKYSLNHSKNISFHYGTMDDQAYKELFLSCDCFVNISSGEGFSITPREALAIGIPTIVTDNTAQTTICKNGCVRAVPCKIIIDAFYPNGFQSQYIGHQFNPTLEDLQESLLDVYNDYDHYLMLAKKAKPWLQQYTVKELLPKWRSFLYPEQILLGDRNEITNEYFMTDSEELFQKMTALFSQ